MKIKQLMCVVMCVVLMLSCFAFSSSAQDEVITLKAINCNVAGLPSFGGSDVRGNQRVIGDYIIENDFDIVAVQEDFGYHKHLRNSLEGYISTNHTGAIPGGDGLNLFTKDMTIYNETRVQWNDSYGVVPEGDRLTPKGILYAVIEIAPGVYVDFYDIHADAFETEGSIAARESNYKQLTTMICDNYEKYDRPIIVTGDFNAYTHDVGYNSNMLYYFQELCGLKDAWIELHNGGDYEDFSEWYATGMEDWGNWDSVEKFMYKDGGGYKLEAVDFRYNYIKDEAGNNVSDHAAAECTFNFTVDPDYTGETSEQAELKVVEKSPFAWLRQVKWVFVVFYIFFSNFNEFIAMIS